MHPRGLIISCHNRHFNNNNNSSSYNNPTDFSILRLTTCFNNTSNNRSNSSSINNNNSYINTITRTQWAKTIFTVKR